jgi:hypothetical protein
MLPLACSLLFIPAQSFLLPAARSLLQAGCPAGCNTLAGGCTRDASQDRDICTQCNTGLFVIEGGYCGCPVGQYYNKDKSPAGCDTCPKGDWCAGGTYADLGNNDFTPVKTSCGPNLTTRGAGRSTIRSCGECLFL